MKKILTTKEVSKLISKGDLDTVREYILTSPISRSVDLLGRLGPRKGIKVFKSLGVRMQVQIFRRFDRGEQQTYLLGLSDEELEAIMRNLKPIDRLKAADRASRKLNYRLRDVFRPEDFAESNKLQKYRKQTVGRLLHFDFAAANSQWTVEQVLEHVRKKAGNVDLINDIPVVDDDWRLVGSVLLAEVVTSDPETVVADIMDKNVEQLYPTDDQERAVRMMRGRNVFSMPVVDKDGQLLGVIAFDDVAAVAEQEATEDLHKSSAIIPLNISYRRAGVWQLYKKRVGWLIFLVMISLGSSGVIGMFEDTLSAAIALTFFIPLLIGSGGNSGAQAATLMIRAISLGEVSSRDWIRIFGKEIAVGASLAVTLGALGFGLGYLRGGFDIGLIVGASMAAIIVVTNLLGTLLPFILTKLKADPAVASGPLVTSVADMVGLSVYLATAALVMSII